MKRLMVVGLCMMFLAVSSLAFADQVYVTQRGKKYHKENCRSIKNREVKALEEKEAIEQGYEPCGRCLKEKAAELKGEKAEKEAALESKKEEKLTKK